MAMTLKSLAAQMRAYRPEADEYKGKHIIPSWADALDAIDVNASTQYAESLARSIWKKHYLTEAPDWEPMSGDLYGLLSQIDNMVTGISHLSAQAKVQDEDVTQACHATMEGDDDLWQLMHSNYHHYEALLFRRRVKKALESFAARLSLAPPGEAVAWRVIADPAICDFLNDDEQDVVYFDKLSMPSGEELEGFTVIPLYTHPAVRAAVPDGWVLVPKELTLSMSVRGKWALCDHTIKPEDFKRAWREMLTAAPQPPEGARVDGCNHDWRMQTDRAPPRDKCVECGAVRDSKTHVLLAAPTLAGKEG